MKNLFKIGDQVVSGNKTCIVRMITGPFGDSRYKIWGFWHRKGELPKDYNTYIWDKYVRFVEESDDGLPDEVKQYARLFI